MDAKLKALKVVELRQILSTANVSVPAKATKNDLISKIQASKPALDAYAKLHAPDDLLAPPEEVDWTAEQPDITPEAAPAPKTARIPTEPKAAAIKPPSKAAVPEPQSPVKGTPVATPKTTTTTATSNSDVDPELEKRKKRSERFGIPLVESKPLKKTPSVTGVTPEQVEARTKKFASNGKKRPAQTEDVDPEELERRKKRAERFGLPVK